MAKKPKLSKNQQRQIAQNRNKRLQNKSEKAKSVELDDDSTLGAAIEGRVVSRFGKQAIVETLKDRSLHKCYMRRTISSLVCGDLVVFRPSESQEERDRGIIEIVHDRRTTLSRPDYYDGVKPVAANIDQIVVVVSIKPNLNKHIIDRYLVACEHAQIKALIVVNKIELLTTDELNTLKNELKVYQDIGYQVIYTSCKAQIGMDNLANCLIDKVNVLVGQSGVGKSSLVNQLLPDSNELEGVISENSGLGQHTTTAAKLIPFNLGGELIDSPGVREFGLWHLPAQDITNGFVEFREFIGACKFSDCTHKHDPGCLIREATEKGTINTERYHSYLKIIDSLDQNRPSYIKE